MSNLIKLMSSDFVVIDVAEEVAYASQTIRNLVEDTGSKETVPLPNVSSHILAKVVEYSTYHVEADRSAKGSDEMSAWDASFASMDQGTLLDVIVAANYLNVKGLLDLTCQTVANMLRRKTPEEIRAAFNIKNDFTSEEEEQLRRDNEWAFAWC